MGYACDEQQQTPSLQSSYRWSGVWVDVEVGVGVGIEIGVGFGIEIGVGVGIEIGVGVGIEIKVGFGSEIGVGVRIEIEVGVGNEIEVRVGLTWSLQKLSYLLSVLLGSCRNTNINTRRARNSIPYRPTSI